ncbi:bis(5'-nucleosyl)-tetraphosphatase (symmetrical) YqeK [Alkalihalobacillus pseudalcaliphilus]|uniref:bis(5'-nucleosyl)-tetraphosphatase (symmetrical) YqeK n=1 Tax=Alkalihalobacillus pseudalcaliphilus TaxID=79884 RepID=UPI00064DF81C|nr:bis(5'-nucleosyl)-tetraphosphatase (symmetrical) YqeK [Alkalihalobacillus pseudalcaliphilus]KMK75925.1 phosphohydrolase [Alkalihalobacillus pseudalcaliphilus]
MEREKALEIVQPHLTEHRYQHTLGVMQTALRLARKFGVDEKKAEIAAIFHDYAKFRNKDEMRSLIREKLQWLEILDYGDELLHAPCGAYYVQHEVGIRDQEILGAIAYHTTGKPGMNDLEKVIFLADYIEPGRHFKGVDEVRALAEDDLDEAILQSLHNTVQFLMNRRQLIFPDTLATYNDFIFKKKRRSDR